jgi:heptosyltransferase-2
MRKVLFIQTAFIGDAVLGTAVAEALAAETVEIHVMVRKGNEIFYTSHPQVKRVWVWDKSKKWRSWWQLLINIRKQRFDEVYLAQRFFTMGLFTLLSGAKQKIGYKKGWWSMGFSSSIEHQWGNGVHEVERLMDLIGQKFITMPRIYPSRADFTKVLEFQAAPYVTLSPSSVWATKQAPISVWNQVVNQHQNITIYLLGGSGDRAFLDDMMAKWVGLNVINLSGQLSLLQSAALMKGAQMNYVNDSGPLHLCSAMNAPVTAFFCSTIPGFGFGPLSSVKVVLETKENLSCRPCGMHGKRVCPLGHFACGNISLPV